MKPQSLVRAARPLVLVAVLLGWVRAGAGVGLVLWAMELLDSREAPPIWVAAALLAARILAGAATPLVASAAASRVHADLRARVFRKILELGPVDRRTGELVSSATEGLTAVGTYAGVFLPMLIQGMTIPLLIVAVIASIHLPAALVLLAAIPLIPGLLRFLERRFQSVSERYRETADRLAGRFLDALQGLPTLRVFGRAGAFGEELAGESEKLRATTMRLLFVNQLALFAVDSLFSLGTVVAASVVLVVTVPQQAVPPGEVVAIVLLAALLTEALAQIGRFFYVGAIGRAAARSLDAFLALEVSRMDEVSDGAGGGPALVELEDVHFAYPGGPPVLRGVSFSIQPGETVALVGPSGAGKSTIVQLLLGFLHPERGAVRVSGERPAVAGGGRGGGRVAIVPQSPYLFSGSLADNLRLANPSATLEQLEEAARAAHLLHLVESLPEGWETQVGERGLQLSGGEVQRLAIARALLRDAPLVIFDEPTSNIDLESERAVREGIARLTAGRTVLVIAHRYSTVAGADRVVVLDEGVVQAEGPPQEVIASSGLFERMVRPAEVGR